MVSDNIVNIVSHFRIPGDVTEILPWGNGLINRTYRIRSTCGKDFLLQQVNTSVYEDVTGIMENIARITEELGRYTFLTPDGRIKPTLQLIRTRDDQLYLRESTGSIWRVYNFIANAYSIETTENETQVRNAGIVLGQFHYLLRDFPAETLKIGIQDFHNPPKYYQKLLMAADRNVAGHLDEVEEELAIIREHAPLFDHLLTQTNLPIRVNHNDPKINNIMFDRDTGAPLCMVDLDTIMPGVIPYDFGDAVRSVMCTGKDRQPLQGNASVFRKSFYDAYLDGFLTGAQGMLCQAEVDNLAMGVRLILWESTMRYLADDLNGDVYLKVNYPRQNLAKARMHLRAALELD